MKNVIFDMDGVIFDSETIIDTSLYHFVITDVRKLHVIAIPFQCSVQPL